MELESIPGGSQPPALPHELRPHLVQRARIELACPAFRTGALTTTASAAKLVDDRGVEPRPDGCRPSVLPLAPVTHSHSQMVAGGRVELPSLAYETKLEPPPVYPAITLVPADGIEPSHAALSRRCSPGEPCRNGARRET
jgi:hypothetical protein